MLSRARWTHLALPVGDIEKSIEFYTTLTPLVVVARNRDGAGDGAWLSNPDEGEEPFVLVITSFYEDGRKRYGFEEGAPIPILQPFAHIGIELTSKEAVDEIAEKARAMGALKWEPKQMAAHIGYICAVNDPDGNTVEFSFNQKVHETLQNLWPHKADAVAS
jgi:catechol 2,3-dioxygenase-like lactoylglutathione lyase family enzyme